MITRRSTIWWLSWLLIIVAALPLSAAQPFDPSTVLGAGSLRARPLDLAQSRPAAGRDTVVIGTTSDADIFSLMFSTSPALDTVLDIYAAIFTKDVARDNDTWRVFPQGVEYLPNVRDGTWTVDGERMTLVWKIRPRRWHDGRPVGGFRCALCNGTITWNAHQWYWE